MTTGSTASVALRRVCRSIERVLVPFAKDSGSRGKIRGKRSSVEPNERDAMNEMLVTPLDRPTNGTVRNSMYGLLRAVRTAVVVAVSRSVLIALSLRRVLIERSLTLQ